MLGIIGRLVRFVRGRRQERNREIFRYWDGTRERGADPIKALRGMLGDERFNVETHPDLALAGDLEASEICLKTVRRVFGIEEFSEANGAEHGLTDGETLKVLFAFGEYMDTLKKNGSGQPTSRGPTVLASWEPSTTNSESDSGSISPEPRPAEPVAS